jgi:hypothetical protein
VLHAAIRLSLRYFVVVGGMRDNAKHNGGMRRRRLAALQDLNAGGGVRGRPSRQLGQFVD